jgi:hypothetical protein
MKSISGTTVLRGWWRARIMGSGHIGWFPLAEVFRLQCLPFIPAPDVVAHIKKLGKGLERISTLWDLAANRARLVAGAAVEVDHSLGTTSCGYKWQPAV